MNEAKEGWEKNILGNILIFFNKMNRCFTTEEADERQAYSFLSETL